ncbi:cytochrome c oxidase assembly protein COX18, mitochondrial-like [Uloborus diversus]|uniref:cytochrome c oxidase assembly protein COX18, mitochondrial-like n=1 Tax=Uloborus diversus TaxID=327109 RepID=UPI0024093818|nr:cytochrome c oxidase assembly protein COX18, mitochondrial-like [Uloborus diversus]XP_054713028.1 cytochrome c oxidase assembly protein COX18, mitochondrial-like [Uloborus diversus]
MLLLGISSCVRKNVLSSSLHKFPRYQSPLNSLEVKVLLLKKSFVFTTCRNSSWGSFYTSLSESAPITSLQSFLIDFHNTSGLPWWAVIMLSTFGIRSLIVFPLAVHQHQVIARLANLRVELGKLAPELNKEVNVAKNLYHWDEQTAKRVFKKNMHDYYQKFMLRDNCHPFKTVLLALLQVPVWICFSISLRNLTYAPISFPGAEVVHFELKNEGTLWFTDLTVPDPIFIPLLLVAVNVILTEMHSLRQVNKETRLQKILVNVTRVLIIAIGAAAIVNPCSVSFYWLCSSTFGFCQNLFLLMPKARKVLRIPMTAHDSRQPFQDIVLNFRKRFMK